MHARQFFFHKNGVYTGGGLFFQKNTRFWVIKQNNYLLLLEF
ncbi:MAG: hypothetical protein RL757_3315 [Bacteroidota bacterium]|jgi:hypothetical protein